MSLFELFMCAENINVLGATKQQKVTGSALCNRKKYSHHTFGVSDQHSSQKGTDLLTTQASTRTLGYCQGLL